MKRISAFRSYLLGAIIVWLGIIAATALIASDQFAELLPVLGGGAFWFIVIVPNLFREMRTGRW
ncbi:MAG TPA: hypothetical protein VHA53_10700 [Nitrolancea sp.]|nr:hypothetical protein [Nitrolancea sp.]